MGFAQKHLAYLAIFISLLEKRERFRIISISFSVFRVFLYVLLLSAKPVSFVSIFLMAFRVYAFIRFVVSMPDYPRNSTKKSFCTDTRILVEKADICLDSNQKSRCNSRILSDFEDLFAILN